MIFQHTHEQVMDGTKTQTRRIVKPFEYRWSREGRDTVEVMQAVGESRLKWQVGRTYAIQPGRGKPAIGRIRLTVIRRERVQDISEEDAEAEGVGRNCWPYLACFAQLWNDVHGSGAWDRNDEVWVLEFERVKED